MTRAELIASMLNDIRGLESMHYHGNATGDWEPIATYIRGMRAHYEREAEAEAKRPKLTAIKGGAL